MSETKNYKLHVTDSDQENFIDWRMALNDATASNMTIIDSAIAEKADGIIVNDEDGTIQLTSKGEPLGSPVQVDLHWGSF